jgi:hypothetical protein
LLQRQQTEYRRQQAVLQLERSESRRQRAELELLHARLDSIEKKVRWPGRRRGDTRRSR